MRKRVLLAEQSDTVRNVAESALRQSGFEVISIASGEKALEVLEFSRPDIIIVACELEGKGHKPIYEFCQENPKMSSVPMLVLTNPGQQDIPLPQEVVINRPFEPKELIEKVNAFASSPAVAESSAANPLSDAQLGDDALDAALGLDQIDVTDSEVMDKTQVSSKGNKKSKSPEKLVGFESYDNDDDLTDSGRVESLVIRDENADIEHSGRKSQKEAMASSGKLEILNDQYGLIDEKAANLSSDDSAHDYNWFINEMQKDAASLIGSKSKPEAEGDQSAPADLTFSEPSSMVDPVTPPPSRENKSEDSGDRKPGVDEFLDEFKKEIEKIRTDEPESITIADDNRSSSEGSMSWQDSLEKMTPEQVGLFTQQFIRELAERVAELIAAKIDSDKLLQLLKREIIRQAKQNQ